MSKVKQCSKASKLYYIERDFRDNHVKILISGEIWFLVRRSYVNGVQGCSLKYQLGGKREIGGCIHIGAKGWQTSWSHFVCFITNLCILNFIPLSPVSSSEVAVKSWAGVWYVEVILYMSIQGWGRVLKTPKHFHCFWCTSVEMHQSNIALLSAAPSKRVVKNTASVCGTAGVWI